MSHSATQEDVAEQAVEPPEASGQTLMSRHVKTLLASLFLASGILGQKRKERHWVIKSCISKCRLEHVAAEWQNVQEEDLNNLVADGFGQAWLFQARTWYVRES